MVTSALVMNEERSETRKRTISATSDGERVDQGDGIGIDAVGHPASHLSAVPFCQGE